MLGCTLKSSSSHPSLTGFHTLNKACLQLRSSYLFILISISHLHICSRRRNAKSQDHIWVNCCSTIITLFHSKVRCSMLQHRVSMLTMCLQTHWQEQRNHCHKVRWASNEGHVFVEHSTFRANELRQVGGVWRSPYYEGARSHQRRDHGQRRGLVCRVRGRAEIVGLHMWHWSH